MKRRMKRTEWLLLILPCFFLLGFGYFLRAKREQKFALVTEKILLSPLTPQERQQGFDTKVTLVMDTRGSWPQWLTAPSPPQGPVRSWSTHLLVFYMKNGKRIEFTWPKGVKSRGTSGARYDENQQRFIAHGLLNLSAVPKQFGKLTCTMQVDLAYVPLPPSRAWNVVTSAKDSIIVRQ